MRILYATDGSEGALAAGAFLRRLPLGENTHIHIVTVRDMPDPHDVLGAARSLLADHRAEVTSEAFPGGSTAAVEAILAAGDAFDADLIVVGASAHSALIRLFVGSVAEGVVHAAHRSVLMVRPHGEKRADTAIVGIDSSVHSREAVRRAESILPPSWGLHLVAVVPSETWTRFVEPSPEDPSDPSLAHETIRIMSLEDERKRAQNQVESLAREVEGSAVRRVTTEVRQGTPADELVHSAEEHKAGLIVVGARGRTVLERFLLGSVSARVLGHAPCSILVVKPPAHPK